jgi:uncharacterized protein (TIGR02271 family)
MAEMEFHRNDRVLTADGMEVGRVKHVIVDGPTRQVTDIVVEWEGREWLMPLSAVGKSGNNSVTLLSTGAELSNAAGFDRHEFHAVDDDTLGDEYRGTATPGSATLEHARGDSAVIDDERGANAMPERRSNDERLSRRQQGRDYSQDDKNITVPVVEEQLKAGVQEREAGRARIVKDVREEQQTIDVPVEREEVYITERTVNRPATEADLRMRNQEIAIPLREQEVVTQKQAVVTGEVNVRKETHQETQRVTDTVRREDVHVEDPTNPRIHVEGAGTAARGTTDRSGTTGRAGQARGTGKTVTDTQEYDAQGNLVDEQVSEQPNQRT